jgi:hypothetical protein
VPPLAYADIILAAPQFGARRSARTVGCVDDSLGLVRTVEFGRAEVNLGLVEIGATAGRKVVPDPPALADARAGVADLLVAGAVVVLDGIVTRDEVLLDHRRGVAGRQNGSGCAHQH